MRERTPGPLGRLALGAALFWLFVPLAAMVLAAFNQSSFPAVLPWKGFTLDWFVSLTADAKLGRTFRNALLLATCVTALSVPLALAGALLLDRRPPRTLTVVFAILVSPILTPGIIIGVSTLMFWAQLEVRPGLFVATLGNASYFASTLLLLFLARLRRFDPDLEDAARDLGATSWQSFRKLLLPWLRPTVIGGTALCFLQALDAFNVAVFTVGPMTTLPVEMAARIRSNLTPDLNALAVLILVGGIAITVAAFRLKLGPSPAAAVTESRGAPRARPRPQPTREPARASGVRA